MIEYRRASDTLDAGHIGRRRLIPTENEHVSPKQVILASVAATGMYAKGVSTAVAFVLVYMYLRWLPQPHAF
jgi:hypothetical protein